MLNHFNQMLLPAKNLDYNDRINQKDIDDNFDFEWN